MATLLIADHDNSVVSDASRRALAAALQIGGDVDLLVAGSAAGAAAASAARLAGVRAVLHAESPALTHRLPEDLAALIVGLAESYTHLLAPATAAGKDVMPRVAALLDIMQVSDIVAVLDAETFCRPIYAGNALQQIRSSDSKKAITVRTSSFAAVEEGSAVATIIPVDVVPSLELSAFAGSELATGTRPDLAGARVVVSGGRALGSKDNFDALLLPLADKLGAAIGASRAAVDAGYASNDLQVGQTGKIVAPQLYIAVGISGAIQHLAGMKDARVIVAINKDPDAPILQVADYGLVGDLFTLLPELEQAL